MNGLTLNDIHGISQDFKFQSNQKNQLLFGSKTKFSPTPNDNLAVTYFEHNPKFDFSKVILKAETLFLKIDNLSSLASKNLDYNPIHISNPYEVKSTWMGYFPLILTCIYISSPIIIGLILLLIILRIIFISLKRKKK